jgi:amidase
LINREVHGRETASPRARNVRLLLLCVVLQVPSAALPAQGPQPQRPQPQKAQPQRPQPQKAQPRDVVHERSIVELQDAMKAGRLTSVALVDAYLARIAAYDAKGPALNAIIRLDPTARAQAERMDRERAAGRTRGPLHGIPVLLKDNYGTSDQPTTGGSIALAGFTPKTDAFQVTKLRDAGAVIIGKANLHELAAGITSVSSMGGQTCNPYDPTRNPGGSSGGTGAAIAASFAAIGWGSDTCGSIRIPASANNLFGLRPTKGLSSIDGIIPLSHTQDVAGPIARTVTDLAIGLDATVGKDPNDPATSLLDTMPLPAFLSSLDTTALRGKRLGVLTAHFGDQPEDQEVATIVRASIDRMKAQGAEAVDIEIAPLDTLIARAGVIDFEFKYDLMDFLARTPGAPVTGLQEILDRGLFHVALGETFRRRNARATRDGPEYRAALARRTTARDLIVKYMNDNRLDAIVYPTLRRKPAPIGEAQRGANCQLSAVTGLPAISMPAGFTPDGLPVGVELLGRVLSDARLVAMAYDFEQAVQPRRAPRSTPALAPASARTNTAGTQAYRARATEGASRVDGTFRFAEATGRLEYTVRVAGAEARAVHGFAISRDSASGGGVIARLAGPGNTSAQGALQLGEADRADLAGGRLALTVFVEGRRLPIRARMQSN